MASDHPGEPAEAISTEPSQYTTTHSLNVAVLAMGLAEHVGCSPAEVRAYGVAGLLHDIGRFGSRSRC